MPDDNKKQETSLSTGIKIQSKKVGLAARRAEAIERTEQVDVSKVVNRITLIFDDSGSMGGDKIVNAKKATDAFLRVCDPNNTAIALYGFHPERRYKLNNDFPALSVLKEAFQADQGTPLYSTMQQATNKEDMTRCIVFSDGSPTDAEGSVITQYIEKRIPVDTVYIGVSTGVDYIDYGKKVLKDIADRTGGIFMEFSDALTFATAFKYLAPAYRAMLESAEFRDKLQKGEV